MPKRQELIKAIWEISPGRKNVNLMRKADLEKLLKELGETVQNSPRLDNITEEVQSGSPGPPPGSPPGSPPPTAETPEEPEPILAPVKKTSGEIKKNVRARKIKVEISSKRAVEDKNRQVELELNKKVIAKNITSFGEDIKGLLGELDRKKKRSQLTEADLDYLVNTHNDQKDKLLERINIIIDEMAEQGIKFSGEFENYIKASLNNIRNAVVQFVE